MRKVFKNSKVDASLELTEQVVENLEKKLGPCARY